VIVRVPADENVKEQDPDATPAMVVATLTLQVSPLLAFTATNPVGDTTFVDPETLKLIDTGVPGNAGLGLAEVIAVVVVP
jgi:hypothetical protein